MLSKDVVYDGILLDEKSVEALTKLASKILKTDVTPQKNMHFTLNHYAKLSPEEKAVIQLINGELGTEATLYVDQIGVLYVDGVFHNIGVRFNESNFGEILLGNRTLAEISNNKIPHVTIGINRDKEVAANAVNTQACFEDMGTIKNRKKQEITTDRISRDVILLPEPLEIVGTASAFTHDEVVQRLDDDPRAGIPRENDAFEL